MPINIPGSENFQLHLFQVEAFTHHDRYLKQLQYLDAAAHVVLRGGHWNRIAGNVQPILLSTAALCWGSAARSDPWACNCTQQRLAQCKKLVRCLNECGAPCPLSEVYSPPLCSMYGFWLMALEA